MNYKLNYHLMPPTGWLNDPNGLCFYKGTYHIYYQYCKDVMGEGEKCWGHYSSKDFKSYKKEEIALFPDLDIDKDGVYSGSTLIEDGMHIFYTGNVKLKGNYDYIHAGRLSNTIHVYSKDGLHFSNKEVVLDNKDYPSNLSNHIRDPKVFKENDTYYMVLGARNNDDVGLVLFYSSKDLKKWTFEKEIKSDKKFGYMWECPDLFKLNGDTFLITCPQGIKQEGYLYENDNQNGYFKVEDSRAFDYTTLDYGYDFYAPSSFVDENNRRILIAWLGLPDNPYLNPTIKDGWQNALSLPRVLTNVNHKIYQYPVKEILDLMYETRMISIDNKELVEQKACQIHFDNNGDFKLNLNNLTLNYENNLFSLIFNNDKTNRKQRDIQINKINEIDIFLDNSTIEIFINKGEKTLSSMYYDDYDDLRISSDKQLEIKYSKMRSFKIYE